MNRKKYITITLILFLLGMNQTHAACTQEDIKYFEKIEDEFKITYEYNQDTKKYDMYLKIVEPEKYYYRIYSSEEFKCIEYDNNALKCSNFPLELYEIQIIGRTDTCNEKLKSIIIDLSSYNEYSEDELCKGIEEFVLCDPAYSKEIEYEDFVSRVETYKRTKKENEIKQEEPTEDKNDSISKITNYIKENLISIIIVVVFIVLLTITIIITAKSIRKSRRLE